jgi:hypothetical protein
MQHPKWKAAQFKPGQSGNPGGRGKRASFEAIVAQILDEKIPGADMQKREALARVFVDQMLKRDGAMIRAYLDREWPARQLHELDANLSGEVEVSREGEWKQLTSGLDRIKSCGREVPLRKGNGAADPGDSS